MFFLFEASWQWTAERALSTEHNGSNDDGVLAVAFDAERRVHARRLHSPLESQRQQIH